MAKQRMSRVLSAFVVALTLFLPSDNAIEFLFKGGSFNVERRETTAIEKDMRTYIPVSRQFNLSCPSEQLHRHSRTGT
ncbi:hypothetical protein F4820DRAFT_92519 [Hypoxylon rubiginosum]|uniref:Uncharacterized protein n=1 Tax=Hypoxylon rubiginosum TaxID=110542 RepID=A0ACB9YNE0_9PEZI|nr:hypothetical protein F4820DRAFT_92519 [Hypoxylon rubiginosum]